MTTGKVLWDTKLPSSPYGSATVSNDLVFTTMFNGKLIAMDTKTGKIVWQQQLPAGTNAPVAIDGDTLVTAGSYPDGKGQKAEIIAYSLSAPSHACDDHDVVVEYEYGCGRGVRLLPRR